MEGLKKLDSVEVIAVVDNSFSVWSDPEREDVERYFKWMEDDEDKDRPFPVASGGLCLHIRLTLGPDRVTILYDAAESPENIQNNMEAFGLDLSEIEAIVMSHGHWDHFGGLLWTIKKTGKKDLPVYTHPWMFLRKGYEVKKPTETKLIELDPVPSPQVIEEAGGKNITTTDPVLIADGLLLRTGEIPRITGYEKGMSGHKVFIDGEWKDDTEVKDDVALVANVKGKGLVVISGCSHAGIINIVQEAQRLTGEERVHAIIGGLHLASGVEKEAMLATVQNLRKIRPGLLVPCHCTGWRARHLMSSKMPKAYVEGSVGHKYFIGKGDVS